MIIDHSARSSSDESGFALPQVTLVRDAVIQRLKLESERQITLRLLEHLADDRYVSQDRFAKQIGIAKGLANAYFNHCLRRGWIRFRQVPRQRYLYYLTPRGFAEKARLTAHFLSNTYQFYREARVDLLATIGIAVEAGDARLGVLGDGELAEIAALVSEGVPIEIVGFVAPGSKRARIARAPVVESWSDLKGADSALLATIEGARAVYNSFCRAHPDVRLHVPEQLKPLIWDCNK